MTQQAQAENIHKQGLQRYSEARAKLEELHKKQKDGGLSAEALAAEETALSAAIDDAQTYLNRAQQLNTLDRGAEKLRGFAGETPDDGDDRPEYLRPMGERPDANANPAEKPSERLATGGQPQTLTLGGHGLSERQLSHVSRLSGVPPHEYRLLTGRDRELLNTWMKVARGKLPERLAPSKEDFARLTGTGKGREQLASPYIDRDGGYITAHEVRNEIIGHLRDRRHIRSRARVIPTNAGSVSFPTFKVRISLKKTRAHKGKVDGSAAATIRDILGKTEFTPYGRMETIYIPEELMEDQTFDLLGFLSEEIAMEAFDDEEGLFLNGTAVNEPYGVLKAPIPGVAHTGSGTGNADFLPEDIKTLPFEVREVFRTSGSFMANRAFYKAVTVMRTEEGGAGTGQFLFQPGLRAGDPPTLVGYEAMESEFFPDHIGGTGGASQAAGDPIVLFGDWRQYWIVDRLTLQIKVLDQPKAEEGQIGFRYRKRLDGAPVRLESWVTLDRK